jgi:endonuclease/exonuclease/phosphatase family metal-dependent hydrolase
MRIATFNLENFDDDAGQEPSLDTRLAIMRPQLQRIAADVLCLQEVHSQDSPQGHTLAALDTLLADTRYEEYQQLTTTTTGGDLYQERNLVTLSRFPLVEHPRIIVRDSWGPPLRLPGRHRSPPRPDRLPPGGGGRDEARRTAAGAG